MGNHREPRRLRANARVCKAAALFTALTAVALMGCAPPIRTITVRSLETAPPIPVRGAERVLVEDASALRGLCKPLGPRLGLLQIRNSQEWDIFAAAVPGSRVCPNFAKGSVIGIVCWAGTPVSADWPVELRTVQLFKGACLLTARYRGGSYLPDGTARLESGYVEGVQEVLVVDLNGTAFYPGAGG